MQVGPPLQPMLTLLIFKVWTQKIGPGFQGRFFLAKLYFEMAFDKIESAGKLSVPRLSATASYYNYDRMPAVLLLDDSTLVVAGSTDHETENDVRVDFCKLDKRTFKDRVKPKKR